MDNSTARTVSVFVMTWRVKGFEDILVYTIHKSEALAAAHFAMREQSGTALRPEKGWAEPTAQQIEISAFGPTAKALRHDGQNKSVQINDHRIIEFAEIQQALEAPSSQRLELAVEQPRPRTDARVLTGIKVVAREHFVTA